MTDSMPLEMPSVKKSSTVLTDDLYNTPKTSLITFCFEPSICASSESRLQNSSVKHASLQGKDIYVIDRFFQKAEDREMHDFSKNATFSRNSYGSSEAISKGEKPARSMNGKERWQLFSKPPQAIQEMYKLFGNIAHRLDAGVTTLPWELCDLSSHGSSSFLANLLEESSFESMELGKHQDCNPEGRISFGIPILYVQERQWHANTFTNGDLGKPWLVSVMLYVAAEEFLPEFQMGTVFYQKDGKIALRTDCLHMRLVLFEGDIFHSIEESKIPTNIKTWRVSYVFKLIINPTRQDQNVKKMFSEWISYFSSPITPLLNASARI